MTPVFVINNFNKVKKYIVFIGFSAFSALSAAGSYEDFFIALQNDQVKVVSSLLSRGFDPNTVNLKAEPALLNALNVGALTSAEVLVRHPKINVNVRNAHGETALMLACLKGHLALAKLLISKQADINQPGWTPLHYAATGGHVELIQLLLEESAYIDAESPNGTTPLMMAARYGSAKATQLLIDEGADIQVKNQLGLTALDFAKQGNRPDAFEIITKAMSPVKADPKNQ
ncbi:MAG: ankyrin repeat domain-containing protein [Pseudomonadota bacterium]|nr:ankyrin repeat domain-containing protein [Pseudomonadota bacterium]